MISVDFREEKTKTICLIIKKHWNKEGYIYFDHTLQKLLNNYRGQRQLQYMCLV